MAEDQSSRQCHLAFISMTLGIFVLICSAVIAGTLLSTSLNDAFAAEELEKALTTNEDLGNIMYALGDELVSSVDLTSFEFNDVKNMIVSQKITNKVLTKVKENLNIRWSRSSTNIVGEVEEKRDLFRDYIAWNEPLSAIETYVELSHWILQRCLELDHASNPRSEIASYIVFVNGMSQRFGEMAMGTVYLRTNIEVKPLKLLKLCVGSKGALEMSVSLSTHDRSKIQKLEVLAENVTSQVVEDMFNGNVLKDNRQFSEAYRDAVREETAGLFLAKEIINNTLYAAVKHSSEHARRNLYFHLTAVVVSVSALILCLIFSLITRVAAAKYNETSGSREAIYHDF